MQNGSLATPLRGIAERKSFRTLVGDAKPKLLDQVREVLRARHYSRRTEQTYCLWVKRFIIFHRDLHPVEMAEPEVNAFLTHLAVNIHKFADENRQE